MTKKTLIDDVSTAPAVNANDSLESRKVWSAPAIETINILDTLNGNGSDLDFANGDKL